MEKEKGKSKEVCDCEAKIAELTKERDDNLTLAKYQKAEFENLKRRAAEMMPAAFRDGQVYAIETLLPVYDGVVEAGKKIANPVDRAGFEIIRKKLDEGFGKLGIEEIKAVGERFDPKLHNAVAVEKIEGKDADIVIEEWQKGFTLHGKVLRPSTVKVTN